MAKKERVTFYSEGDEVVGTIFIPDDLAEGERRAGVVFASGYNGERQSLYGPAEDISSEGYVALTFDYRGGVGESKYKGKVTPPSLHMISPETGVRDVRSAITYLLTRREVNPERMGLFGQSAGASFVVSAAAAEPRVACVVSEGGIGDGYRMVRSARNPWEFRQFIRKIEEDRVKRVLTGKSELIPVTGTVGGKEGLFILSPEEWESWTRVLKWFPKMNWLERQIPLEVCDSWLEFKPELVADKISPRPIMFMGAETSVLVPPEEVPLMYEKAKEPKKLIMFPASVTPSRYAKLRWDKGGRYVPALWEPIVEWFRKYIPPR